MSGTGSIVTLSLLDFDAVLFDLDGVLTPTAQIHAAAWKRMFDDFMQRWSARTGTKFVPFDSTADYRRYVDGKPRTDGTASFLASRGIDLPAGSPEDGPEQPTEQGLSKLKDQYFSDYLRTNGIAPYEAAVTLVRALRAQGLQTAVVSSSSHCAAVLEAAGIAGLFDTRVDGEDITRMGLRGKPAPDAYLEGARRLAVSPDRAAVVEDAIAGVAAGHAGHFGLVIGVDHVGQSRELREAGADVIVTSLAQIQVASEPPSAWVLAYDEFDPAREGMREALCALGNGYFATRGAAAWARADGERYPGTYLAGGYNRLQTELAGRVVENEDLVNFPNWLALGLRLDDETWFDERRVRILTYRQELDVRSGTLLRTVHFEHGVGRRSTLTERRLVSMSDPHLAALELTLTAENWSGFVTLRSAIDGRIVNSGAQLYRPFNNRHLEPVREALIGSDGIWLLMRTSQSGLQVAEAALTRVLLRDQPLDTPRRVIQEPGYIAQELTLQISAGDTVAVEKIVALYTSRDRAISECALAARKRIARAEDFATALAAHTQVWKHLWRRFDVHITPARPHFTLNVPLLLRLNIFHLLQTVSPHSTGLDIGVPARGWTGEGYQGHIFWDELFISPTLNFRVPEITRALLLYRYRRLGEARAAARAAGYQGAMFPWQSGSDGQEQTQRFNLNPRSQRWVPDNSYLQRHVGSAIAWNVWQYFQVTNDMELLQFMGAELILEIARFWASMARLNERTGRYEIRGVMGPDEYHEGYPDAPAPGLNNNAYTNIMAVWVLCRALDILSLLSDIRRAELASSLKLSRQETASWDEMSRRMFVPFHDDGIISQFEGYEDLTDLDWDAYRARYGNIQRLELILEAEHDSANRYKLSKQADVLMLFYLFSAEELAALLERLGYAFDPKSIPRIVSYYDKRSSHGSTLSRVVHAWVLARSNRERAITYFAEALQSDVNDIQQGTTAEGIHLGAMAGTVDLVQRVVTGLEATGDVLRLNPQLPDEIDCVNMRIRYRGQSLDLRVTHDTLTVSGRERGMAPIRLALRDQIHEFVSGTVREFRLQEPGS
jgi:beta-phosphoglucomutase family hydrolase